MGDIVYTYDGDCIESLQKKTTTTITDRLEGQFFDMFPDIDIEVHISVDENIDIDGLYYHTYDDEDSGLIEICVKLSKNILSSIKQDHLETSIQSILVHEMQHVIQRCYLGIDLDHAPEAHVHLASLCEIDARIEEVVCNMNDEKDRILFKDRMLKYLEEFYVRNNIDIDYKKRELVLKDHILFYEEKILGHLH